MNATNDASGSPTDDPEVAEAIARWVEALSVMDEGTFQMLRTSLLTLHAVPLHGLMVPNLASRLRASMRIRLPDVNFAALIALLDEAGPYQAEARKSLDGTARDRFEELVVGNSPWLQRVRRVNYTPDDWISVESRLIGVDDAITGKPFFLLELNVFKADDSVVKLGLPPSSLINLVTQLLRETSYLPDELLIGNRKEKDALRAAFEDLASEWTRTDSSESDPSDSA